MNTLQFQNIETRRDATGREYLRGETAGRRHYSIDNGVTWHRTLARAMRGDRRGREGREAREEGT